MCRQITQYNLFRSKEECGQAKPSPTNRSQVHTQYIKLHYIISAIYLMMILNVRYFHDFRERIPRAEMLQLQDKAFGIVNSVDSKFIATICGSFRRGESSATRYMYTTDYCIAEDFHGIKFSPSPAIFAL